MPSDTSLIQSGSGFVAHQVWLYWLAELSLEVHTLAPFSLSPSCAYANHTVSLDSPGGSPNTLRVYDHVTKPSHNADFYTDKRGSRCRRQTPVIFHCPLISVQLDICGMSVSFCVSKSSAWHVDPLVGLCSSKNGPQSCGTLPGVLRT
ncbi:UNVERIFIED_CONTAM: hypothetical protein FKN15_072190 [Acipenser sinensis]